MPDWLSAEVQDALAAIDGEHVAKKHVAVLLLAQATATTRRGRMCSSARHVHVRKWYG